MVPVFLASCRRKAMHIGFFPKHVRVPLVVAGYLYLDVPTLWQQMTWESGPHVR